MTIESLFQVFSKCANIEEVILYGSRAKGNFRDGSDIDLTLKGKKLSTSDLLRIENQIEELILPYKIDLSLYHQIKNPDLIEHINRVGVLFNS
jgi:predicted nucleotidyltransferase